MLSSGIPLTLGIIGHLDAIITVEHKNLFNKILTEITVKYPNSPIVLFSQLAQGTDTEVAKVFLEFKEQCKKDFRLVVPLPFEQEEYISEFSVTEKDTFHELIAQAQRVFVLENQDKLPKNELYRNGGKFVADSSIILLALYENEDNNKKGGTADIVRYKIKGTFKDDVDEHIFDNKGSLIIIPCKRESSKTSTNIDLNKNFLNDLLENNSINRTLNKIENSNRELAKIQDEEVETSANYLYFESKTLVKPNAILRQLYASFDAIALRQQKKYLTLIKLFFLLGLFILSCFEIYKHIGLNPFFFIITIALISFAFLLYKQSHKIGRHTKYLEYRVIAEGLRVQFFWNISDIKKSASNYILRIHKTEFNWIKHLLSSIYGYTYNDVNTRDESIQSVKNKWILNQKIFFEERLNKLGKNHKKFRLISRIVFMVAFLALLAIFILEHKHFDHHTIHILIVVDSVLFGFFALIKAYYVKRGYEQIRNQYSLMQSIFSSCYTKMNDIESSSKLQEYKNEQLDRLLFLAGKEALIENGNWYLIFKEKEPEVEGIGG